LRKETVKDPQLHTFTVLALSTASRAGEFSVLRLDLIGAFGLARWNRRMARLPRGLLYEPRL
jgi:hypothetical protein